MLLIAANFNAWATEVSICIPQHAFDCWKIVPGTYDCEEMLGGEKQPKTLSPDHLFDTVIPAYGAAIWKCKIKTASVRSKKTDTTHT